MKIFGLYVAIVYYDSFGHGSEWEHFEMCCFSSGILRGLNPQEGLWQASGHDNRDCIFVLSILILPSCSIC